MNKYLLIISYVMFYKEDIMQKNKGNYVYGISDKKCGICGKTIIATPEWLYKLLKKKTMIWYCSYTCYRKAGGDSGKYKK